MYALKEYSDLLQFTYKSPFSFATHSSIGCGGIVPLAIYPQTVEETVEAVQKVRSLRLPYAIVGNVTNTLAAEPLSTRIVICMKNVRNFTPNGNVVFVGAGLSAAALIKKCLALSLGGVEFLEGIPCTLGGALYMNAGVSGAYIADVVDSVLVLRNGKVCNVPKSECGYAYKTSVFMHNDDVILGATLCLQQRERECIIQTLAQYRERRAHLPKGKSMGCIFKNPSGQIAGKLLEGAGLKGLHIGGAHVSPLHANFIINDGKATTQDIKALIAVMKNAVFAQYNVALQEEIQYIE